jgi:putative peptide zinc metalloprotease protein
LLYLGLIFIKTLHEFGHAYFCRKFGGEVHVMGILLMIFTPVPYVDATSSWGFAEKRRRLLVGAAGMIVELFVAALAVFVWVGTSPGVVHSLAYNLIFIASVSTVLFNVNPLLRFDGYYLLSDWLEIPNLAQRANRQLRHLWEHYVYGVKKSESPASSRAEAGWLTTYGIASGIYRVFLFAAILLVLADRFLILGMLMAAVCAISWVVVPTGRFIRYLASSPQLDRVRPRAVGVTVGLAAVLILLLAVIPFPSHFRAPGIVQASQRSAVFNEVAGVVQSVLAEPGSAVVAGQALVRLEDPELEQELRDARARLAEVESRLLYALNNATADIKPLRSRKEALTERLAKLERDRASLTVQARHGGTWVAPGIHEFLGRRIERGSPLGLVVDTSAFEFTATVLQEDADTVFVRPPRGAEIRVRGQAGNKVPVQAWRVTPGGTRALPSAALGWGGGGEVAVSAREPTRAVEAFFEVHADLPSVSDVAFLHGRSGKIRFDLEPEPLLPRWMRRLWQLLQKRYQL